MGDATELEVQAGLEVARRYRLDPFKQGQIWFIKRWDKNAVTAQGSRGAFTWTPQVGIYGLLHIAARDHADYGSISEPEYGPLFEHEVKDDKGNVHKFKAPEWCRVKAYKKGISEPTVATIYFEEFCPKQWENVKLFWARSPRAQIAKCCRAQVVRIAYPDLGGLYIPEEMDRSRDHYTPAGRQITYSDSQLTELHQARVDMRDAKSPEQARAARERFNRAAKPSGASESNKGVDNDAASRQAKTTPQPNAPDKPTLTIDWSYDEQAPRLTGDAEVIEAVKGDIHASWGKDEFWHIQPRDAEPLRALALDARFRPQFALIEITPKSSPGAPQGARASCGSTPPGDSALPASQGRGQAHGKRGASSSEVSTPTVEVMEGVLEQVNPMNPERGKNPRLSILLAVEPKRKYLLSCFDDPLFKHLLAGKDKSAELVVKVSVSGNNTFRNVIGLKRVGSQEFDSDGKTPCIQNNTREAGGQKTLY